MRENCPECKVHSGHKAGCSIGYPKASGDFSLKRYREFLKEKCPISQEWGIPDIQQAEIFETAVPGWKPKPHQVDGVEWGVRGGRRALFESFGLGKTVQQLEILRLILKHVGGRGLIVAPLGVRQEFMRDAKQLQIDLKFVRSIEECGETGIYLTNYETVRDGKLNPGLFTCASLDEAAILSSFGGTKTFREFMRLFASVPYRFVATATPDPNEYIELLAYADFLGIMDVSQAKTRFFKRDSTKADKLTIHPHKEKEFWLWVSTWALFLNKPSDLGYDDAGYALPELIVVKHEVKVDHSTAQPEKDGQYRMYREASHGVSDAAREKRDTLPERIGKMQEILAAAPEDHFLIWHDLEAERHAIEKAVPDVVTIYGAQRAKPGGNEEIEAATTGFNDGQFQYLAGKPDMIGSGMNAQRNCHMEIFLGIGFKFRSFIQAVHRCYRFLQDQPVTIHLIYAESERLILQNLMEKWDRHKAQTARMAEIIREYGLSQAAIRNALSRGMGVERQIVQAKIEDPDDVGEPLWTLINNDVVEEIHQDSETGMPDNFVHLILTSIPFSTQYEYSPNYADFGHSDSNEHFFEQMDFAIPQLYRVLQPGRLCCVHVKDRIVPGGITGLGFQIVYPFHMATHAAFTKHGFAYLGMKTIVTDVVRENNQTYRLGWTEQCKDGTKMGVGMPEYLLIFRKPPTDTTNAYADQPVIKRKPVCTEPCETCEGTGRVKDPSYFGKGTVICQECNGDGSKTGAYDPGNDKQTIILGSGYSRARWQLDAHGFERSSGNRLLTAEELEGIAHAAIYRKFRRWSKENVYNYEHHVHLGETLEAKRMLPSGFMLLPPQSWHPDVWTDVTRMRTLNGSQWSKGKEMHLCPMQFDVAYRVITQCSQEGEIVFDPFNGLGTVVMCAVEKGRRGIGTELSAPYFRDSIAYVRAAEQKRATPTLFDMTEFQQGAEEETPEELEAPEPVKGAKKDRAGFV